MKQHITPKQFKEMDRETAIRLFDLVNREDWFEYHHKKVTIGKMIEIIDTYSNKYSYMLRINQSLEGYYRVEIDVENGFSSYHEELCDGLWSVLKFIIKEGKYNG